MLCQQFTAPSDGETCPGERVTVTCVTPLGSTIWRVTPGGDDDQCSYSRSTSSPDMCGPDDRFMSSRTEGSSDINNSSLSVTLTDDLNETLVECLDSTVINANATGSYNICVIGNNLVRFQVVI